MRPVVLALALAAAPPRADLARAAIEGALSVPGARAEVLAVDAGSARCSAIEVEAPRPVAASGRAPLRLRGRDELGRPCEAWAWARVRVSAPTLVTIGEVAEGAPLAGVVTTVVREVAPGHARLGELPEGARAARALGPGTPLAPALIRIGPAPGDAVTVAIATGALRIEEVARAAACRAGRACAILPSGRRVEGVWHGGRIVIESP